MVDGDKKTFKQFWNKEKDKYYTHWTKDEPNNQIQLAFRNHWLLFNELFEDSKFNKGKRCLEIGCGRGSISSYFSDAGYDCTLADISEDAIEIAKEIFEKNNLKAQFCIEDANKLTFSDNSFDVVVSIGLLEHFEDIETPIKEQIRVLDKGGIFLGYIVPKYEDNVQREYKWINEILSKYVQDSALTDKKELFRSDFDSKDYMRILESNGMEGVRASGIYSVPMISHSIDFPFSLMPEEAEKVFVRYFEGILSERKKETGKNPWLCEEGYGQAFLVWGFKK